MKIVFFGNGKAYSLAFAEAVVATEHEVVAMVSPQRADLGPAPRPSQLASRLSAHVPRLLRGTLTGATQDPFTTQLMEVAQRCGAQVLWPETINDLSLIDQLEILDPDLVVMAGFTEILGRDVIGALSPILNVHPSLLPAFRGPHPEFWTIAEGATEGGVTIHLVDKGIDTGDIVAQARFPIESWLTAGDFHHRCIAVGTRLLTGLLADLDPRDIPRWEQSGASSYYGKVSAEDLIVPYHETVRRVFARSQAAAPWLSLVLWVPADYWLAPVAVATSSSASRSPAKGFLKLALGDAIPLPSESIGQPGTLRRSEEGGLAVACQDGTVFFRTAAHRNR